MSGQLRHVPRVWMAVALSMALGVNLMAQTAVFRTGVDLVNLSLTVLDKKGGLIGGLTVDDFDIYEDGKKQDISYFSSAATPGAAPDLHLALLLDVSSSMGPFISFIRTAAIRFINALPDALDVSVADFDNEVRVARYNQSDFPRLVERIRNQRIGGTTALYDAIGLYLDGASTQDGKKIMLLYTDGDDTISSLQFPQLLELLRASDVTVYCVGKMDRVTSRSISHMSILSQIADVTGGEAFFPLTVQELDGMYKKILDQVRSQYTIGYTSTNSKSDGSWRKVEIRLVAKAGRDDLKIRSRAGYYGRYVRPASN